MHVVTLFEMLDKQKLKQILALQNSTFLFKVKSLSTKTCLSCKFYLQLCQKIKTANNS